MRFTTKAYTTGTLAVLFLIGTFATSAHAQDGWRAARKPAGPKTEETNTEHRTRLSAPVRLASYQKEIPLDETDVKSGPSTADLKTAQLQAPVQVETQPGVTVSTGETVTTYSQVTPQTVYYPQTGASVAQGYAGSNCACVPQATYAQPAYTTYYAPAGTTTFAPATATSYTSWRPLLDLTPTPQQQYIGQGLLGQPKVYVPGQPIMNVLRYISP